MTIERTLSIIKPDAVKKGQVEAICRQLKDKGFHTVAAKYHILSLQEAEAFYADHVGKDFFESCIQLMVSGKIFVQILEKDNAIALYRQLMGATDPQKASAGTLRAEFGGKTLPANAVHGSDSTSNAEREIAFFFKESVSTL